LNTVQDKPSDLQVNDEVKKYYREIEHYDWVKDPKYPEKLFHMMRAKEVSAIVNNSINNGQSILDVGCGTGLITRLIHSDNITALDINPWALERAKINTKDRDVAFVLGDAEAIPFPANTFDIVVCTEMLEHLVRPDLALRGIYRILKPGGRFIGSVPSKSVIWKYRKLITTTSPVQEPFHNNFTIKEFTPLLNAFKIVEMNYRVFGLTIIFIAQKIA
jgi:ubiquinone/menaquinone biosynthesis C-methylase UbiE